MLDGSGSKIDEAAVRAALDELTAWEYLRRSPQLLAFLTYVVEAVLRDEAASVKAYSIAVDVFGRPEDFDPQSDPIVRVQARRLRSLLEDFDRRGLGKAPIRILIPVGRYVPQFLPRESPEAPIPAQIEGESVPPAPPVRERTPGMPSRSIWVAGTVAIAILAASIYFWPELSQRTGAPVVLEQPRAPLLLVEEFENMAMDAQGQPLAAGLAVELVADFNLFHELSARYGGSRAEATEEERRAGPVYVLSGVVSPHDEGAVQYAALLRTEDTNVTVAVVRFPVEIADGQPVLDVSGVAREIVLHLASPLGPLHRAGRAWVMAPENHEAVFESYPCMMAYYVFRETRQLMDYIPVLTCAEAAMAREEAVGQAIAARIYASLALRAGLTGAEGLHLLAQAAALADAAIESTPASAFVWEQRGNTAYLQGDGALARRMYSTALQINSAALYGLADSAFIAAGLGDWAVADALVEQIFAAEPEPPSFFYAVPALRALRDGDYERAVENGRLMALAYPDLSAAIIVAAGGHMDDFAIINTYLPQLLVGENFRQMGIMPFLRRIMTDTELQRQFGNGIARAGVSIDRLARPF